jgi:methionyl-tRNA formyltransferase
LQISVASSSLIAVPIIEAILASEHTLASVISTPDKKAGRGQVETPTPLAKWSEERGFIVAKPFDTPTLNQHLLAVQPQLIITASYGRMIPVEVLHGPRFGWLNVHFSLLPRWRGAAPVQWALLEGDHVTGITIFKLDKGMDTGPIYLQEEVEIVQVDTTTDLLERMSNVAAARIMDVVADIRKGVKPKPQPATGVTLAPKISKEMARIDWRSGADAILRQVRALDERPGTWSTFRTERVAIHKLHESLLPNGLKNPGEIALVGTALLVRCADSVLEIAELTPSGKKRMSGADFARGARLASGESFE